MRRVHGSGTSERIVRGERANVLPGRFTKQETERHPPAYPRKKEQDRKKEVDFKTANATNAGNPSRKELKTKHEEKETKKETVLEMNTGRIRETQTD